jgi:uncharacterized protein
LCAEYRSIKKQLQCAEKRIYCAKNKVLERLMNVDWSGGLAWLNPPPYVQSGPNGLEVRTGMKTDFWQGTFYGFHADNGHCLLREVEGDFTASLTFSGNYRELYDQAGLMLRLDEKHWIKAGVEFSDGVMNLSVVVTNGNSDWSVIRLPTNRNKLSIRAVRQSEAVRIQYLTEDGHWHMVRLAWLQPSSKLLVGPMCCSPQREGFEAVFHHFSIDPPLSRDLHA